MAGIVLQCVTRRDGARALVDAVSLSVADGECVALAAPPGAGKTALLRVAAGLDEADGGDVLVGERDVTELAPDRRGLGLVFPEHGLYPHLTVRGNLEIALAPRHLPALDVRARAEAAARAAGVAGLLDARPGALGAADYQRAALARALVREPEALLLDDPLRRVEPAARAGLRAELARLRRERRLTVLWTTRDLDEAMAVGERVGVLREGRLEQLGAPADLYERPASRFVAALGGSPMNFVELPVEDGRAALGGAALAAPAAGPSVVLGVRPEDLRPEPDAPGHEIVGRVELVEPAGGDVAVRLETGGHVLVARFGRALAPLEGEELVVRVAPRRLRWFASDSAGKALEAPAARVPGAGSA